MQQHFYLTFHDHHIAAHVNLLIQRRHFIQQGACEETSNHTLAKVSFFCTVCKTFYEMALEITINFKSAVTHSQDVIMKTKRKLIVTFVASPYGKGVCLSIERPVFKCWYCLFQNWIIDKSLFTWFSLPHQVLWWMWRHMRLFGLCFELLITEGKLAKGWVLSLTILTLCKCVCLENLFDTSSPSSLWSIMSTQLYAVEYVNCQCYAPIRLLHCMLLRESRFPYAMACPVILSIASMTGPAP